MYQIVRQVSVTWHLVCPPFVRSPVMAHFVSEFVRSSDFDLRSRSRNGIVSYNYRTTDADFLVYSLLKLKSFDRAGGLVISQEAYVMRTGRNAK